MAGLFSSILILPHLPYFFPLSKCISVPFWFCSTSYLKKERKTGPSDLGRFWYQFVHCFPTHFSSMHVYFCFLPHCSSSRLSPAGSGSSSSAVLSMKKANAQLALFHYLLHPWGVHNQCLQPCVAWLSIALLMGSLGSTKSSNHILLPSTFSPADPWAEFAVGRDGCMQL